MPSVGGIWFDDHSGGASAQGLPPLVLIHGAGGHRLFWPPELRRLAGRRVCAIDLPGHGRTPGEGCSSIEGYAAALVGWLEALGIERAVFAGHSMGGAVCLWAGLANPERMAGLILVGSGGRLRVHPSLLEITSQPGRHHQAVELIVEWGFSAEAPPRLVELARRRMDAASAGILHDDLLACDRFDVLGRLNELRMPTLVAYGSEDRLTPERHQLALAAAIPGAVVERIEGAGHLVMVERPVAVRSAFERFLAGERQTVA